MELKQFFKNLSMKMPRVQIQGAKTTQRNYIPFSPNPIVTEIDQIAGNVDLDFETPSGVQFGGGLSSRFFDGETNFPKDIQDMGAPASQKFGTGLTLEQLRAYLGVPIDDTSDVRLDARFTSDITEPTGANITYNKRF
jgi:hypothetical protein|tara:strand:+ start:487 stop:900 length:414 start_codon:yes stop_codon:yes gene_type:complete